MSDMAKLLDMHRPIATFGDELWAVRKAVSGRPCEIVVDAEHNEIVFNVVGGHAIIVHTGDIGHAGTPLSRATPTVALRPEACVFQWRPWGTL